MFSVGDKVVCVNDTPLPSSPPPHVKRGAIYVIDETHMGDDGAGQVVSVEGIDVIVDKTIYWYLCATRFRKIQPCEPEFIDLLERIKPKVDA